MRVCLIALVLLFAPSAAEAACTGGPVTWNSTLDIGSVLTCVNNADDGDTILVAGGNESWGDNWQGVGIYNKCISLIGSGIGVSVVRNNHPSSIQLVDIVAKPCATGHVIRVSGFDFQPGTGPFQSSTHHGLINVAGDTASLRIDNNRFVIAQSMALNVVDYIRGVIDNNTFQNTINQFALQVEHNKWLNDAAGCDGFGRPGCGDRSWASPLIRGSTDQLYLEDNHFQNPSGYWFLHDCSGGAREVWRFNRIEAITVQQHDEARGGRAARACLNMEAYRNYGLSWRNDILTSGGIFNFAGGTGVVFDNDLERQNGNTLSLVFGWNYYRMVEGTYRQHYVFNSVGQRGISQITCTGGVATVTVPDAGGVNVGHWMSPSDGSGVGGNQIAGTFQMIISGSLEVPYNGQKIVTSVPNINQWTFNTTCAGTANNPGIVQFSPWDENRNATGYRGMSQPGAGPSAYPAMISGYPGAGTPNCSPTCTTMTPYAYVSQSLMPIYGFNNRIDTDTGAGVSYVLSHGLSSSGDLNGVVNDNRDYYNQNTGACVSGGGCTAGVGRGTALPTSCTPGADANRPGEGGVGFWLTTGGSNWNQETAADHTNHLQNHTLGEDGALYRCSSTNTWTLEMQPAAYPHYLRTGGVVTGPPTISITSPSSNGQYDTSTTPITSLSGTSGDAGGSVTSVTWACVPACGSGTATGTTSWSIATISIPANDVSTVTVTATDNDSSQTSAALQINHVAAASGEADNFNRDNWPTLGPATRWVKYGTNGAPYSIVSNRASGPASFDHYQWPVSPSSANQCAQLVYISGEITPLVRRNGVTGATLAGYGLHAGPSTFLVEWVSGAGFSLMGSPIGVTWNSGDIVKVCVEGTAIRGYRCTPACVQIGTDQVDTTLSDGEVGFTLYNGVADDFLGGNLTEFGDTDPVVTITSPTNTGTYETTALLLTVSGTAVDNGSVVSNAWTTDQGGSGSCTGTTSPSCANIPLIGNNVTTITVTATDNVANTGSDTLSVLSVPVPGTPSDSFTRPDWPGPGPNWTVLTSNVPRVANNFLVSAVEDHYYVRWNAHPLNNDQCATIKIGTIGGGRANGVGVRASADTGANRDMYRVWTTGTTSTSLVKEVNGVFTVLVDYPVTAWVTGDLMKLCVTGAAPAVLSLYRTPTGSGEVMIGSPQGDASAPLTSGAPLAYLYGIDAALDDFSAENTIPVGDETPPVVTILTPTAQPTLETSLATLTVTGSCTDNVGISNVTFSTNQGQTGTATGTSSWSIASVTIPIGTPTVLSVVCHDTSMNDSTADTLTITRISAVRRVQRPMR